MAGVLLTFSSASPACRPDAGILRDALALVQTRSGPAPGSSGGLGAEELPDPGPWLRLLPGPGGRGTGRATAAGEGRPARRGSVLAGPQPEQAGHPRLARRRLSPYRHHYHRDHLGIVTNNFGNVIRIGEGDEVRDVIHPLSPPGWHSYDYALGDSLAIRTAQGEVTVRQIAGPAAFVRPPLVVGLCTSMSPRPSWSASASALRQPAYLDRSSRTSASCWRTRCTRIDTGCRTVRRSRSAAGPPGSTFPPEGSSAAAGKSATTI